MKNNKGFSTIALILIVLTVVTGGYFGYMYLTKSQPNAEIKKVTDTTNSSTTPKNVTKQRPTDMQLVEMIRKDLGLSKTEEILIDDYQTTEKYEVVFAEYQYAAHMLSKAQGSDKWIHEFSQQQGPNGFECKILDKVGLTKYNCFNYDTQKSRINGTYGN